MIFVLVPGGHMNENLFEYSDIAVKQQVPVP